MTATLLVREPTGSRVEVYLGESSTIGRGEFEDVQLNDPLVSRVHGAISLADDCYWLQDRSSTNGTYLNGAQVYGPQRLSDGDTIAIGDTTIIFNDTCRRGAKLRDRRSLHEMKGPSLPADRRTRFEFPCCEDSSSSGSVND